MLEQYTPISEIVSELITKVRPVKEVSDNPVQFSLFERAAPLQEAVAGGYSDTVNQRVQRKLKSTRKKVADSSEASTCLESFEQLRLFNS
ncbi:MAG: hypothetical protein F6K08_08935 [Okeania sp. SIO1H6]|nr:hypothetical protein [Okeania sp. SIO1H6]RQH26063.1 hypothetical protein D4Z78_00905 [Okeania hirsuta]